MANRVLPAASRPTDVIVAPTTNPSLRLAQALAGVNEELGPVLGAISRGQQEKQEAKALRDALASGGAALADAVREGKIEKTQNPFYVQAYEKAAGEIRGRAAASTLMEESQTWEERSDPAKYQQRFASEMGTLAQGFTNPDALNGFFAGANPVASQALQQNVQYNVSRTIQEHEQNVSTKVTTAILQVSQANGGKPTAAQVWEALDPSRKEWIGTGGTEAEWDLLTINSVVAAAFNSGNSQLLSVLDDNRGGKGALSNIAGPDGQPVAQSLATARYRIEQEVEARGTRELRAKRTAVAIEGMTGTQMVWDQFGYGFLTGEVSQAEIVEFLQANNISAQGAAYAVGELQKAAADNTGLSRALQEQDVRTLELYTMAARQGYSRELEAEIAERVRTKRLTVTEGQQLISTAMSRTNHLESEARSDARAARSDARAEARDERLLKADQAKSLKSHREGVSADAIQRLESAGIRSYRSATRRRQFDQALEDAETAHLLNNPGDVNGARQAVRAKAASIIRTEAQRRAVATGRAPTGGNPRENPRN